jgi:hypothetical protein
MRLRLRAFLAFKKPFVSSNPTQPIYPLAGSYRAFLGYVCYDSTIVSN